MARRFAVIASLALLGAPITLILADDPPSTLLEEAATRARLAKQALQETVTSAISKASKLSPDAAAIVIREVENEVNAANYLTPDERKGFLAQLKGTPKGQDAATKTDKPAAGKAGSEKNDRLSEDLKQIEALD